MPEAKLTLLLAAAGADWEAGAMAGLAKAGIVVARRCVDVPDLIAAATARTADQVVVAAGLPGLDSDAVRRLMAAQVGVLAIAARADQVERLHRIGVAEVVIAPTAAQLVAAVLSLARARQQSPDPDSAALPARQPAEPARDAAGVVVACWGPTGAPGRTTVVTGLAAEQAAQGRRTVLVDADPYGGVIGQNLGVMEEVSGLLAASRRANEGTLTPDTAAACRVRVAEDFEVLTGLPRPDRWSEVHEGALSQLIEITALHADVFVDAGFGLESDPRRQGRDRITLEALERADVVIAVGSAEPAGLVRLARGLVDLGELDISPDLVVINRMRDSLGWSRAELATMVNGYAWHAEVQFVRHDQELLDRAVVAGKSLPELGEAKVRADLRQLLDAVLRCRTARTVR